MTFRRWLIDQAGRQDEVGDLARDLRRDVRVGCLRATSAGAIWRHLQVLHKAEGPALEALAEAEKEWNGLSP